MPPVSKKLEKVGEAPPVWPRRSCFTKNGISREPLGVWRRFLTENGAEDVLERSLARKRSCTHNLSFLQANKQLQSLKV